MADTPPNLPDSFEDAERFKRLFIDPAVEAMGQRVEAKLAPILSGQRKVFAHLAQQDAKITKQGERIDKLEGSQKKALVGWGVFATAIALAGTAFWNWLSSKFTGRTQ